MMQRHVREMQARGGVECKLPPWAAAVPERIGTAKAMGFSSPANARCRLQPQPFSPSPEAGERTRRPGGSAGQTNESGLILPRIATQFSVHQMHRNKPVATSELRWSAFVCIAAQPGLQSGARATHPLPAIHSYFPPKSAANARGFSSSPVACFVSSCQVSERPGSKTRWRMKSPTALLPT